jgi:threonine/homoserine/homoserine lactone efflux protein
LTFLGLTFLGLAVVTDLSYVFLSDVVRRWLPRSAGRSRLGRFMTGSVYVGLGLAAAFGGSTDDGT